MDFIVDSIHKGGPFMWPILFCAVFALAITACDDHTRFLYGVQGSACLGLTSKTHVVLAALKRAPHELASYQKKILKIDDHMGIAIAGLNADARSLAK